MIKKLLHAAGLSLLLTTLTAGPALAADAPAANGHSMDHHGGQGHMPAAEEHPMTAATDPRPLVRYPEPLRLHTLNSMRDHLKTLGEIQQSLAEGRYGQAAELAEQRLGMSSLQDHRAHEVARYMPPDMQAAGTAMHQAASRFAITAQNASASGDLASALASLAKLSQTCVACHAGYRLQ